MLWLYITILAYFLNAISITIDKFLITKEIPKPAAYTFNIGMLNIFIVLVLLPWSFHWLTPRQIFWALSGGALFTAALYFMYQALKRYEASRLAPYIGSLNPLFIFVLASLFLGETLTHRQLIAFFLILIGGFLISWEFSSPQEKRSLSRKDYFFIFSLATLSAFLFAASYTITKYVYDFTNFLNGFVWTRFGLILGALFLLIFPKHRQEIKEERHTTKPKAGALFLFGQSMGGLSYLLVNYAFSLNSVTLVQGMQGLQYGFLFLITLVLSKKFPQIIKEKTSPKILAQKIIALIILGIGLYFLMP